MCFLLTLIFIIVLYLLLEIKLDISVKHPIMFQNL